MCKLFSFSDHLPTVDSPLQNTPLPDFDASPCITKFGSFYIKDLIIYP